LNALFFYQLVLKKVHFFVNYHSTLFMNVMYSILLEFTIKIYC